MTDKLLPIGTYVICVQAVGGLHPDGGLLSLHVVTPVVPCVLQSAALKAIDTFVPKELEMLPAGAWWHVSVAYHSSLYSGSLLAAQEQLIDPQQSEQFLDVLGELVPRTVATIAYAMAERIGVSPPPTFSAERPVL